MARFLNKIDDSLEPTSEGEDRLKRVRPILHLLGKAVDRPGLGRCGSDSIGTLLCAAEPDAFVHALMTPSHPHAPKVAVHQPRCELLTTDAADRLDAVDRMQTIAVRNASHVARLVPDDQLPTPKVRIDFEDKKASIVFKRPRPMDRPCLLDVTITAVNNGARKILKGEIDASAKNAVERMFAPRDTLLVQRPQLPLRAKSIEMRDGAGFFELPTWLAEHFATVFQDVYRLQSLIKAATDPNVSRPLQVETVRLHRHHDPVRDRIPYKTVIRGLLHPTSVKCVCCAHFNAPQAKGAAKRVDFELSYCGLTLHNGRCHTHPEHTQATGATVCGANLKASIVCRHENGITYTQTILPADVWSTADTQDVAKLKRKASDADAEIDAIRKQPKLTPLLTTLMHTADQLCVRERELPIAFVKERQVLCDNLMLGLDRDLLKRKLSDRDLIAADVIASEMLRSRAVRVTTTKPKKDQEDEVAIRRFEASKPTTLTQKQRDVMATHGHLFLMKKA